MISKTVDTRYARLELETDLAGECEFRVNGTSLPTRAYGADGAAVHAAWYDTFAEVPGREIEISLYQAGKIQETVRFNLTDVMFAGAPTS